VLGTVFLVVTMCARIKAKDIQTVTACIVPYFSVPKLSSLG